MVLNVGGDTENQAGEDFFQQVISQIITAANATTQSAVALTLTNAGTTRAGVLEWVETVWANDVQNDGRVYGYITPRLDAILSTVAEYSDADFVNVKPFEEGTPTMRFRNWLGVLWAVHTGASGQGTAVHSPTTATDSLLKSSSTPPLATLSFTPILAVVRATERNLGI